MNIDFKKTYGDMPQSFSNRVQNSLENLDKKPVLQRLRWTTAAALALLVLSVSMGIAAILSPTANIFGWLYGREMTKNLQEGEIASSGQSYVMGDVEFTLDDVIRKNGSIYSSGRIRKLDTSNIVLIAEYVSIHEPAGYTLHYGRDTAIDPDAKSYQELAVEKNAKIIQAACVAEGLVLPDGSVAMADSIGFDMIPQADGSIRFLADFEETAAIQSGESYTLRLHVSTVEIATDGEVLHDSSYQSEYWDVQLHPNKEVK